MKKFLLTLALIVSSLGAKAWKTENVVNWKYPDASVTIQISNQNGYGNIYLAEFDANGNRIKYSSWENYYGLYWESERTEFAYDAQNNCVSKYRSIQQNYDALGWAPIDKYEYKYDAKGNLIEKVFLYANDFVTLSYYDKEVYSYDDENRCTTEIIYRYNEGDGAFSENDKLEHVYDKNGYLVEDNYYSPSNGSWSKRSSVKYTNDEKGNCISELEMILDDGQWRERNGSQYKYTYDSNNNKIEALRYYNGEVVNKTTFVINEKGLLSEEISYDENDISLKNYKTIYTYDENGKVTKVTGRYFYNGVEKEGSDTWHDIYYENYAKFVTNNCSAGFCGAEGNEENVTWSIDDNGVLTISGTGAMKDYEDAKEIPWCIAKIGIKKVVICDGVTNIGDKAFYGCVELESFEFAPAAKSTKSTAAQSTTVEKIGEDAFKYCYKLGKLILPEGVKVIDEEAFAYCNSLEMIDIPSSVNTIESEAFYDCTALSNVVMHGTTPPTVKSGNFTESIYYVMTNTLHVPTDYLQTYSELEWAQKFTTIKDDADTFDVGVENVAADVKTTSVRKVIENGRIIIIKDGKRYNALGVEVK